MPETSVEDVLEFWFTESKPQQWFMQSDAFDAEIERCFGQLHARVKQGELDFWQDTPEGALALVIVLDQFSRNLFRESSNAFACDEKAISIARKAIANGFDKRLKTDSMRQFLYMPFMHAEDIRAQEESLKLFASLENPQALQYAQHHHDVVARFGRFPHRNKVLNREPTKEEVEFLKDGIGW